MTSRTNTSLQVHPTTHVADKASLSSSTSSSSDSHPIVIGAHTVVHPFCRLDSANGPILIGDRCVIWEKASLGGEERHTSATGPHKRSESLRSNEETDSRAVRSIALGDGTVVHPHVRIAGPATIGENCSIGVAAEVGPGAVLGEGVTVASAVKIPGGMVIEKESVVFGEGRVRKPGRGAVGEVQKDLERMREMRMTGEEKHRALMKKLVKGTAGGPRFTG